MKLLEVKNKFESNELFLDEIIDKVVKLGEENPNFVYTYISSANCSYNGPAKMNGQICGPECSGCIYGQALQSMGWSDEDELNISNNILAVFDTTINRNNALNLSYDFARELSNMQKQQDSGRKWGDCVISLKRFIESGSAKLVKSVND